MVITPRNTPFISRLLTHLLTINPNFQRDIQEPWKDFLHKQVVEGLGALLYIFLRHTFSAVEMGKKWDAISPTLHGSLVKFVLLFL